MSKNIISVKVKDGNFEIPEQVKEAMRIRDGSALFIQYDNDGMTVAAPNSVNSEKMWEQLCQELQDLHPNITEEEITDIIRKKRDNRTPDEFEKLMKGNA